MRSTFLALMASAGPSQPDDGACGGGGGGPLSVSLLSAVTASAGAAADGSEVPGAALDPGAVARARLKSRLGVLLRALHLDRHRCYTHRLGLALGALCDRCFHGAPLRECLGRAEPVRLDGSAGGEGDGWGVRKAVLVPRAAALGGLLLSALAPDFVTAAEAKAPPKDKTKPSPLVAEVWTLRACVQSAKEDRFYMYIDILYNLHGTPPFRPFCAFVFRFFHVAGQSLLRVSR